MKKKYFSPTINVYNIVEAETILAGSKHELTFITDVTPFVPTPKRSWMVRPTRHQVRQHQPNHNKSKELNL